MKNLFYCFILFNIFALGAFADIYTPSYYGNSQNAQIYQSTPLNSGTTAQSNMANLQTITSQPTYLPGVSYQPFVNVDLGWNQHTLESLKFSPIGMSLSQNQRNQPQQAQYSYYGRPAYRQNY